MQVRFMLGALCLVALAACTPSPDKVAGDVMPMLQSQLDTGDFKEFKMHVDKIVAIHESENKFQGIATVTLDGEQHEVPLEIVDDGDRVMFKSPPGAFAFTMAVALRRAQEALSAPDPSPAVNGLISEEEAANEKCRGGSGDDPTTGQACDRRDELVKQLAQQGQCWGPPNAVEADKRWIKCQTN